VAPDCSVAHGTLARRQSLPNIERTHPFCTELEPGLNEVSPHGQALSWFWASGPELHRTVQSGYVSITMGFSPWEKSLGRWLEPSRVEPLE